MNRKRFRSLRLIVATALIATLFSLTAFAGWESDGYGNWYYWDDYYGYYVYDTWVGNYYIGSNGIMMTNAWTPDGYYVGADGAWTGQSMYNSGNYYGNTFQSSPGRYYGATYYSEYSNSYVQSVYINGDILTVVGSLEYDPDPNNPYQAVIPMNYDTYQFQLYSGTQYLIIDEQAHYVSKSQFMNMYGPAITIEVINGLVTSVYYSA